MRYFLVWLWATGLFVSAAHAEPGQAQSPLVGVWTGSVGKQAVTVCFNNNEENAASSGSYYYQRYLRPIALDVDDRSASDLSATAGEANGTWHIRLDADDRLSGSWTSLDSARVQPIELTRAVDADAETIDRIRPCDSDVFNHAIDVASIRVHAAPVRALGALKYRTLAYTIAGMSDEDYKAETIELIGKSPAITRINNALRKLWGEGSPEGELLASLSNARLQHRARSGLFKQEIGVSVVGHWLIVDVTTIIEYDSRMNMWENTYMWDVLTGKQESLFSWLDDDGPSSGEGDAIRRWLPEALDKYITSRFGKGDPSVHLSKQDLEGCYGAGPYEYRLVLREEGIDFVIPVRSNGACGESIKLTFKALKPFLNREGLRYIKELERRPR